MTPAVLFDCDGVLVDSEPAAEEALRLVLSGYGYEASSAELESFVGIGDDLIHDRLSAEGAVPCYATFLADLDAATAELDDLVTAFDDAVETVRGLALEGIPLAVASSSRRINLDRKLARFDLARYFSATVAGDEVAAAKPSPDVFLAASGLLGVSPAFCVVVEDSVPGAMAAVAAGMRVVVVRRDGGFLAGYSTVSSLDSVTLRTWMGLG